MKPYNDIKKENHFIRTFDKNVDSSELVWHKDKKDRYIEILEGNDWFFQFDNEFPKPLNEIKYIPKNTYHRLIKGDTNLTIKIIEK
jgi:hypothetical protein